MRNTELWKYCDIEHSKEFLLSFQLLNNTKWTDQQQIRCLYAVSNHAEKHYCPITISKRDGTPRHLFVPDPLLKKIQKNILHHILDHIPVSSYATAYHKGAGIMTNASVHVGQKQILKLDIEDFFGNIIFPMVYKSAFSNRYFPPAVSTLLTYLCCYKDYLPQGAPTSAAISNLVMRPFDEYMGQWSREREITYTRYCDDMTFSGDFDGQVVKNKVQNYLREMGFTLNEKKTNLITRHNRQSVTGITVNSKPQVSKQYRKELRQEVYYCNKFGVVSHLKQIRDKNHVFLSQEDIERYLYILLGKVNFILQVNPEDKYFLEAKNSIKNLIVSNRKGSIVHTENLPFSASISAGTSKPTSS